MASVRRSTFFCERSAEALASRSFAIDGLPLCFKHIPPELSEPLRLLSAAWAGSCLRPRPANDVIARWQSTVEAWAVDETLPLLIRKPSLGRGTVITHATGRELVPVDNSPAVWIFAYALRGDVLSVDDIF